MRILLYASHLLHWRSLIPVAVELSRRGHHVVVQTTRAEWRGMPRIEMAFAPQRVCGINRQLLDWLAGRIGYGQEWQWQQVMATMQFSRNLEAADVYVSTVKDIQSLYRLKAARSRCVAVGYQHLPVVIELGPQSILGPLPAAFRPEHPFCRLHKFEEVYRYGHVTGCGFPHLDNLRQVTRPLLAFGVQLQHHGGYRKLKGHDWMLRIARIAWERNERFLVSPHWVSGFGYGAKAITRALAGGGPHQVIGSWWPEAQRSRLLLTTGSASMYEFWAAGIRHANVIAFVGGGRHEKFQMFSELILDSEDALRRLLDGGYKPCSALTDEVMESFRSIHTGQGAKTAADVIEGKR